MWSMCKRPCCYVLRTQTLITTQPKLQPKKSKAKKPTWRHEYNRVWLQPYLCHVQVCFIILYLVSCTCLPGAAAGVVLPIIQVQHADCANHASHKWSHAQTTPTHNKYNKIHIKYFSRQIPQPDQSSIWPVYEVRNYKGWDHWASYY